MEKRIVGIAYLYLSLDIANSFVNHFIFDFSPYKFKAPIIGPAVTQV